MALLETFVDLFDRTALGAAWTANGAGITGNQLYVNASVNNGAAVYSSAKSAATWTWSGSSLTVEMPTVPTATANAQVWVQVGTGAVNRIGFEYVATNTGARLDLLGQTTNYAPIGTTTSVPYDPIAHRWLRLLHSGTAVTWQTSPNGVTWTTQRVLNAPPAWTTQATLQVSLEAFRTAGANDTVRFDNLNAPPAPASAATGTVASSGLAGIFAARRALAAGTVSFSGQAGGTNLSVLPPTDMPITISGTANGFARRFLYAEGYPTVSPGGPLLITSIGAAAGSLATSGTATAQVTASTLTANGALHTLSTGDGLLLPGVNAILTVATTGTASANTTSSDLAAAATVLGCTVAVVASQETFETAAGAVSAGAVVDARTSLRGAANGELVSAGAAYAGRLLPGGTASGTVIVVGGSVTGGARIISAVARVNVTAAVTSTHRLQAAARGTLRSSAVTSTDRSASARVAMSGVVVASKGWRSAAAAVIGVASSVDGRRVLDVDSTANVVTTSGTAGSVIGIRTAAGGALAVVGSADSIVFTPLFREPARPALEQLPVRRLRLLVVDTITGRVAFELPFSALQWNSPLNAIGSCTATVPIEATLEAMYSIGASNPRNALREVLLGPYRFSLVVAYGNVAVFGGPLLPTDDEEDQSVRISAVGFERLLEKRVLANRSSSATLALGAEGRDIVAKGTTPAYATYLIVAYAINTYTTGRSRSLPIVCSRAPAQLGDEDFAWKSYDLVSAWKAVGDLVARPDGPDFRLEPILYQGADAAYVQWDMQIGTPTFNVAPGNYGEDGPLPWTWDDQTARINRSIDAVGLATDYFATGGGQDRDKKIALASSDRLTSLGFPVLENVDSGGASEEDVRKVQIRANALQAAHATPNDSWKLTVPVDGDPPLGSYRRGDVARIEVRRKLLIESGAYLRRITDISGDASGYVSLACDHEDDLVEA